MKTKFVVLVSALAISSALLAFIAVSAQKAPRKIKAVHEAVRSDVEDLITYRAMPSPGVSIDQVDPFLFLNHHGPQVYPPSNNGLPFGPHPHKGFETLTFILDGDVAHKDNGKHESVIKSGGVQWMTAGKGIIHSEVSSEEFKREGGRIEVLQLWMNLPSKLKNTEPNYVGLQADEIPVIQENDGKVSLHLVAGQWQGQKAPIQSLTGTFMSWLDLEPQAGFTTSIPESRSIFLYVVEGSVRVNGQNVKQRHLVEFGDGGTELELSTSENAVVLFGHAEPTNEPVAARGPFVMNTEEELQQAYEDYRAGKFGSWH